MAAVRHNWAGDRWAGAVQRALSSWRC